ncbi:filamentous hemagglutinin N-terminal domain-containing protein [Brasilonema sp. CT11]|nr:filamentous hemagglutinin N-terminal domain-containing protein [Brasilonema sp. CT11]
MRLPLLPSLFWFTLPLCIIGSLAPLTTAVAQQVTSDGTVSTTVITRDGKNFTINDGTRRGGNLFHSFKEFSVPTGGSAVFENAADVQNIINRVTGGSISNIDGLIKANGAANVFLLNPAGIIFGPNARLNIGGSFLGSTANSFIFDNNFEFSATNPQAPPLLTINVPIGLRYRDNPGEIQVRGPGSGIDYKVESGPRDKFDSTVTGLQVEPGKTLALVGGNVSVEGGVLKSQGGRIEIGSFDSNQVVNLVPAQSEGFSLAYQGTPSFRDIQFSGQAFANVTGDGGGSIAIIGRNINFTDKSVLLADTLADKNGGEISIVGDSISFNRSSVLSNTFSSGDGAQIKLNANNIKFDNGSGVSIQTWDKGKAGDINIIGANSLEIKGSSAFVSITTGSSTGFAGDINMSVNGPMVLKKAGIETDTSGTGNAGKINISANSLQIDTSGVYSRALYNTGKGGEINFNVTDSLTSNNSTISTNTYRMGDAGKININANSFRLENGGVRSEAREYSTAKGGEINITVAGTLELPQSAGITTTTYGKGDAGKINISAGSFLVERSEVSSSTTENSTGNAGEINITAGLFKINAAGVRTNNSGSGNAGDLKVRAKTLVLAQTGLEVNSTGNSNAGDLEIVADTIKLDDSSLNANTRGGKGNISVNSFDFILRQNGKITTNATATADGGNIKINTDNLVAIEKSQITANAQQGYGGKVSITTKGGRFLSPDSVISAASEAGPQFNGTVQFNTPDTDPTRGLFELSETVIDPAQQIAQNPCIKGSGSSFTITGRGGLPTDPNNIISNENVLVDLIQPVASTVNSTTTTQKQPSQQPRVKKIIPAQGWIYNEKGQVVLVGYDPTKTGPVREQPAPTSNCAAR